MKAFLDYLQEISICPDINIHFGFCNDRICINFTEYSRLWIFKMDSYNFSANGYKCKSQRIFYLLNIFSRVLMDDYPINTTSMRFL